MHSRLSIKTCKEKRQLVHLETLNTIEHNTINHTPITRLVYILINICEGLQVNILVQRNERKFASWLIHNFFCSKYILGLEREMDEQDSIRGGWILIIFQKIKRHSNPTYTIVRNGFVFPELKERRIEAHVDSAGKSLTFCMKSAWEEEMNLHKKE